MTSRQSSLLVLGFAFIGLIGADPRGCGPFQPPGEGVPPVGTSGGTSGTSGGGTSGSSGTSGGGLDGGCMQACDGLDEADCTARSDCRAVYTGQGCVPIFDHCEAQPSGCTQDSDCAPDQYCSIADCDIWGPCPAQGTCEPKPICPEVACATADPDSGCGVVMGPDGCPVCQCNTGCTSDAACPGGQVCRPGPSVCDCASTDPNCTCAVQLSCVTVGCNQDADCQSGEKCEFVVTNGSPADVDGGPMSGGICMLAPQPTVCGSDADCASNEVCAPDYSSCPPGTGTACDPAPICQPAFQGCSADADCPSGEVCAADPNSFCGQNGTACPTRLVCQQPQQPGFACGNSTCAADEVCVTYGGISNVPVCVAYPRACSTVPSCDCLATEICGASDNIAVANCSGAGPAVDCMYP